MLQQPVIIGIAYYVVQWNMDALPKWLLISTLSLVLTLALHELLIRWLFGMKPRHRLLREPVQEAVM